MKTTFFGQRLSALVTAVIAVLAFTVAPATVGNAEISYSSPDAPTGVYASASVGGVTVHWTAPATANPAITNYVISAGPGSCAVTVPATASSAVLPIFKTASNVTPIVQAVNEYGFSVAAAGNSVSASGGFASSNIKAVQVLQLSDFHGAIETSSTNIGASVLTTAFAADRALVKPTITLSSGDNFGAAPPISAQFEEMPSVEAMNGMGIDVSTFGNHEHDRTLEHVRKVIAASKFKWTVANYSSNAGMTSNGKKVSKFEMITKNGVKIGVVGINTADTLTDIFPGNLDYTDSKGNKVSINIDDKISTAQSAVNAAKKAGADLVVVLLHNGWNFDAMGTANGPLVDYTKKLTGVAAVFGGHSHQKYASVLNGTLVAEVRNSGVEYTRTQICVNTKTNKVLGAAVEYIDKAAVLAANYQPDTAVEAMVQGYKAQLTSKMDVKIGTVASVAPRGGTPAVERSGEAAIGSYTADAMRARYGTDFALINGGGIRDTLPAKAYVPGTGTSFKRPGATGTGPYDVLLGDAYTVFPFGNTVSIVNITGKNLWAALENGVSQYPTAGRWPQVSGIRFTVDVTKPAFARVTSVTKTDGTAIAADDKSYSVATVDYMVYGGDGYTQFDPSKQKLRDLLVDVFADALKADLAAGKVSNFATDGRITVIK